MSTLKGIVEKAAQIRNDEHYIVGHNKYIDHIKKYDENIYEVALIFNPATVSRVKNDQPPIMYKVRIDDIFISKKLVNGEPVEVRLESLKTDKFINHMDDAKIIYDQVYVGTSIYDKLEQKSEKTVIFFETDYTTHEKGSNVYTIHNYKVVNMWFSFNCDIFLSC